jgi:hypothetical protein
MSEPLSEQDESRARAAEALDALRRADVAHRAALRRWRAIAILVGIPLVTAAAWLFLVGYERHILEVRAGPTVIRFVSRHGPFEVCEPGGFLDRNGHGVPGLCVVESLSGPTIEPRGYDSAYFASTTQRVELPPGATGLAVEINSHVFELRARELIGENRTWPLSPGRMLQIDVDRVAPSSP